MNRSLKFRVWDGSRFLRSYARKGERFEFPADTGTIVGLDWFSQCERLESPKRFTVTQFTGVLDQNDKEIYEGDLVSLWFANDPIGSGLARVEWGRAEYVLRPLTIKEVDMCAGSFRGCKQIVSYDGDGDPIWEQLWHCASLFRFGSSVLKVEGNVFENPVEPIARKII